MSNTGYTNKDELVEEGGVRVGGNFGYPSEHAVLNPLTFENSLSINISN